MCTHHYSHPETGVLVVAEEIGEDQVKLNDKIMTKTEGRQILKSFLDTGFIRIDLDIDQAITDYREQLEKFEDMLSLLPKMVQKDRRFGTSLYSNFRQYGRLSEKQWGFVKMLAERYNQQEPIYGSFDPILVMFRLAESNGLKAPKIRLLTKENTFVQLNFKPGSTTIDVYIDGWQGHGHRKFAGWIAHDQIRPFRTDRMTEDVKTVIQDLALDPLGTAKAMAARLGNCMYCNKRLSDDDSKSVGYGRTCAKHFGLPHPRLKA